MDLALGALFLAPGLAIGSFLNVLAARMPRYMVPRYLDVVDELPRNATTLRLQKFLLRERGVTATTWDRESS